MPYEISTEVSFSSAHYIDGYEGDCASLHGHNWRVRATLRAGEKKPGGMTFDFRRLKSLLSEVVKPLDHSVLNDLPPFKESSPTAENIAECVYRSLSDTLTEPGVCVARVEVWESPLNCAVFYGE